MAEICSLDDPGNVLMICSRPSRCSKFLSNKNLVTLQLNKEIYKGHLDFDSSLVKFMPASLCGICHNRDPDEIHICITCLGYTHDKCLNENSRLSLESKYIFYSCSICNTYKAIKAIDQRIIEIEEEFLQMEKLTGEIKQIIDSCNLKNNIDAPQNLLFGNKKKLHEHSDDLQMSFYNLKFHSHHKPNTLNRNLMNKFTIGYQIFKDSDKKSENDYKEMCFLTQLQFKSWKHTKWKQSIPAKTNYNPNIKNNNTKHQNKLQTLYFIRKHTKWKQSIFTTINYNSNVINNSTARNSPLYHAIQLVNKYQNIFDLQDSFNLIKIKLKKHFQGHQRLIE